MTCSDDGTVRIWDTHNLLQKTVIKPSLLKPGRTAVTAVTYNGDGKMIGAGLMDGSIQLWSIGGGGAGRGGRVCKGEEWDLRVLGFLRFRVLTTDLT